jgi:hypothetical protein
MPDRDPTNKIYEGDLCCIFAQPFLYILRTGTFLLKSWVNNCLKYKSVQSSCPFSGHLRPLLGNLLSLSSVCSPRQSALEG